MALRLEIASRIVRACGPRTTTLCCARPARKHVFTQPRPGADIPTQLSDVGYGSKAAVPSGNSLRFDGAGGRDRATCQNLRAGVLEAWAFPIDGDAAGNIAVGAALSCQQPQHVGLEFTDGHGKALRCAPRAAAHPCGHACAMPW